MIGDIKFNLKENISKYDIFMSFWSCGYKLEWAIMFDFKHDCFIT